MELPEYKKKYFEEQQKKEVQEQEIKQQEHLQRMIKLKQNEEDKNKNRQSAATDTNDIWYTSQYKKSEWREHLNQSLYKTKHNDQEFEKKEYNPDVVEERFNQRKTRISEYSNARHNNQVFINPTFTSC